MGMHVVTRLPCCARFQVHYTACFPKTVVLVIACAPQFFGERCFPASRVTGPVFSQGNLLSSLSDPFMLLFDVHAHETLCASGMGLLLML
jgi:hypothetical protein